MLRNRIITAFLLIPIVLWIVISANAQFFALASFVFFIFAAVEWAHLCHLKRKSILFFVFGFTLCAVSLSLLSAINLVLLMIGSFFWLFALYAVIIFRGQSSIFKSGFSKIISGIFILAFAWYALNIIHALPHGSRWIVLLFVLVWSTDTFAYFSGKTWGKHALAPHISPNKTIEGLLGGVLGAFLLTSLCFYGLQGVPLFQTYSLIVWESMVLIAILICVLGDLFESLIKRLSNVKDSGTLLPGHGGILDRVDSLIAALPFYALSLVWLTRK